MRDSENMPDARRTTCRICGKSSDEVGPISWRGKCMDDAKERIAGNMYGMVTMSGPYAQHWRRRMAASVGATLPDEARS